MNQNLVEKLDFFGRAVLGQTANERALGIVFAHGFGNALHERRAVHDAREVAQDLRETQALREHLVGNAHQTAGVARKKTVKELGEEFRPAHAEHVAHFALGDARRAVRDRLVQKREAVAHGAAGALGEEPKRARFVGHAFGVENVRHMRDDAARRHVAQVELQTAREHRDRHLLRIRRREDELHVFGRLLEGLEHRVEGRRREHVHFVDHVDLVAALGRRVHRSLEKRRHVFDRAVARRVHLDVVAEAPLVDRAAGRTHAAGFGRDVPLAVGALTVERLGEDARDRGLPDAARSREEIGVVQAFFGKRPRQGRHDVILTDDRLEIVRAPLARQNLIRTHAFVSPAARRASPSSRQMRQSSCRRAPSFS